MIPSRLPQMTVTGTPRRLSSSSSGRRSARRARLATLTTEPRVAHQVGQRVLQDDRDHPGGLADRPDVAGEVQAPVPQRPLGDRGQDLAPPPRRPADGVDQHQRPDEVRDRRGRRGSPRRRRRSGRPSRPSPRCPPSRRNSVEPGRIAGQVELVSRAGPACRRSRGGPARTTWHPWAASAGGSPGRCGARAPSRGAKHDRQPFADHAVERRDGPDPGPLPDHRCPGPVPAASGSLGSPWSRSACAAGAHRARCRPSSRRFAARPRSGRPRSREAHGSSRA